MKNHPIIKQIEIMRIKQNQAFAIKDHVIDEHMLTIVINGRTHFKMVFSMTDSIALAAGFLFTQGIVVSKKEILDLDWLPDKKECHLHLNPGATERLQRISTEKTIKGSSGGALLVHPVSRPLANKSTEFTLSSARVLELIRQHGECSKNYQQTGALHSAGLCKASKIDAFFEDIGRHNAVDKLAGHILLNDVDVNQSAATLSCRMSVEITGKIIKTGIPLVISNAAPTLSAIKMADQAGLTMIGFARQERFNIYTHAHRVRLDAHGQNSSAQP
jgi:FdhD protein